MTNDLNVFFTNYIECSIKKKIVFNLYVYIVPDNLMNLYSRVTVANVKSIFLAITIRYAHKFTFNL